MFLNAQFFTVMFELEEVIPKSILLKVLVLPEVALPMVTFVTPSIFIPVSERCPACGANEIFTGMLPAAHWIFVLLIVPGCVPL
jgi:hypothetical protein